MRYRHSKPQRIFARFSLALQAAVEYAKDRILMGAERKSAFITPESKRLTAYHEGGHALVAILTKGASPVHKATIMPRGQVCVARAVCCSMAEIVRKGSVPVLEAAIMLRGLARGGGRSETVLSAGCIGNVVAVLAPQKSCMPHHGRMSSGNSVLNVDRLARRLSGIKVLLQGVKLAHPTS